jgi:hypothetical protein
MRAKPCGDVAQEGMGDRQPLPAGVGCKLFDLRQDPPVLRR